VLCIGLSAKPYIPAVEGLKDFRGICHHTSLWPQEGVDFKASASASSGTGASGVQVLQEVYQEVRRPHGVPAHAKPGAADAPAEARRRGQAADEETFPERFRKRAETFAGFDYDVIPKNALDVSDQETAGDVRGSVEPGRLLPLDRHLPERTGHEEANDTAYAFWRDKVRARIKDPAVAEKLAPMKPMHPFGV